MAFRFYTPPLISGREPHPLLAFRFGKTVSRGVFNEDPSPNFFEREATFVERVEDADAVVLPHNFVKLDDAARAYIAGHAEDAQRAGVPVYLFSFADLNDTLRFDRRVFVFRLSGYKSSLYPRDIIVPTTAMESDATKVVLRPKSEVPVVSFCGFAGFKTPKQWVAYALKNAFWEICALFRPALRARKLGVYWRRATMRALKDSPLVRTNFIVRRSFSGASGTIELPPAQARAEFVSNIVQADFVLSPKGDGNYSNRLLETLSLGRIPVLIDTDVVLPLEDKIDYTKIIVRVPMHRIGDTAQLIREFYDALSAEEWHERQRLARKIFDEYLRQDVFLKYFFNNTRYLHG